MLREEIVMREQQRWIGWGSSARLVRWSTEAWHFDLVCGMMCEGRSLGSNILLRFPYSNRSFCPDST